MKQEKKHSLNMQILWSLKMIAENYTMNCYCEECDAYTKINEFSEFIGNSRQEATKQLKYNKCWISKNRQYFLCSKHNTKENRNKYCRYNHSLILNNSYQLIHTYYYLN